MSPAATQTAIEAERAVLDAADRLFYQRGLALVTMAEVRDEAAVSMRRLYVLYPTKRELVAAWLNDRHLRWMSWFASEVERQTALGGDPLIATFDAIRIWCDSTGFRGCAFLNSIAETSEIDDLHREIVATHKRALIQYLVELASGDRKTRPPWLPEAVGVMIDGAIVQAAVFGSSTPVLAAKQAAQHLLSSLSARASGTSR